MTQVVCWICKELVQVIDKKLAEHGDEEACPTSGMRYVPSPRSFKAGPGAPKFELLGSKVETLSCECGAQTADVLSLAVRMTTPDPTLN